MHATIEIVVNNDLYACNSLSLPPPFSLSLSLFLKNTIFTGQRDREREKE
jgi:hypothetical protein